MARTFNINLTNKSIVTVTKSAASRLKTLLKLAQKKDSNRDGILISTRQRGCNGHSYKMDYTTRFQCKENMEKVISDGVNIFIDNKSLFTLIGCEVDYENQATYSGFVFNNPNAKGNCGCGESFNI
tara:strand:- start:559 stop:936 length:378 start_codon:yes stop_codon:yes gene_type:complete